MHNFLFVGGGFASGNLGVDAITLGSMRCIRGNFPDAQFKLIDFISPSSVVVTHSLSLLDQSLEVVEASTSFRRGVGLGLRTCLTRAPVEDKVLKYFWWADMIIDISAGDGFGETYGYKNFLGKSLGKWMALRLNKPLVIFPQTMGPFNSRMGKIIARYLLLRANLVLAREEITQKIVQDLLGKSKQVTCLADMAFLMEKADISNSPVLLEIVSESAKPIGINVSGFLWNRGHEIFQGDNHTFDYRKMMVELVSRFINRTGQSVILIPHVISSDPRTSDVHACQQVIEQLEGDKSKVQILSGNYSAPEIKAVISECNFFIGARMHACIAALSTETPLAPISYSHKFEGIIKRFGIENWIVDPKKQSIGQALDLVFSAFQQREDIKTRIQANLPGVKVDAMRAGILLKEVLKS